MARNDHWQERVLKMARERRDRSRQSMLGAIRRPVRRRPNTSTLLEAAIADPASVDPTGRARLAQWAAETYGERAAMNIMPYLGVPEDEPNGTV